MQLPASGVGLFFPIRLPKGERPTRQVTRCSVDVMEKPPQSVRAVCLAEGVSWVQGVRLGVQGYSHPGVEKTGSLKGH